jgi:dTDP-4-amino-4,6-dideoxygalactose transaminase
MTSFLPFALPDIGEDEIAEVVDSLRSGWLTTGPKTMRFEEEFARALGGGVEAVAVNSATSGLHLAVEALGIGPGDEVIVPTHTFTATAEVVRYMGADPIFVDCDLQTYCISPDQIESKITSRTKAIIPVHYAGLAAEMDAILSIAERTGLKVVEDAAHAFPTRYNGDLVGTLQSSATVFSFYATKTLATGEGGMLVTRESEIAKRARCMRLHGIDRDAFKRYRSDSPAWYYEVLAPGFKYNMTDIAAALGLHQLRRAEQMRQRRGEIAERYDDAFASLPVELPPRPRNNSTHSWHLYVLRLSDAAKRTRDEVMQSLFSKGIGASVHYVPLHRQPYWRDRYRLQPEEFPNSELLYARSFSLPIYSKMTDADVERVIEAVRFALA